jgi:glycosyltransferase involved in cell wall biosynthesis
LFAHPLSDYGSPITDDRLPTLLYIGTLADWQGLDTLIQALPLLVAERPLQLRLVGRGRKRQ